LPDEKRLLQQFPDDEDEGRRNLDTHEEADQRDSTGRTHGAGDSAERQEIGQVRQPEDDGSDTYGGESAGPDRADRVDQVDRADPPEDQELARQVDHRERGRQHDAALKAAGRAGLRMRAQVPAH
jgi:hypothetical protein